VTSLACDRGNFTPVTYTCNEVAYVPQYVTYSAAWCDVYWMYWMLGSGCDLVETWQCNTTRLWAKMVECGDHHENFN
jgi:hypothetical protein